jgi:hypothetical protein
VPVENFADMGLRGNVIGTLSILAAAWAKTSFAFTLLRLMNGKLKAMIWAIIITVNLFMGLNALFIWVRCSPVKKSWVVQMPGTCWRSDIYPAYGMFAAGKRYIISNFKRVAISLF